MQGRQISKKVGGTEKQKDRQMIHEESMKE